MKRRPLWLAVLLAPLIAAIAFSVFFNLLASLAAAPLPSNIGLATSALLFAYVIPLASVGLCAMLLVGIPAHAALMRAGRTAAWIYLLVGFAMGSVLTMLAIAGLAYSVTPHEFELGSVEFALTLCGAIFGMLLACSFWILRRPDRDEPNPITSTS